MACGETRTLKCSRRWERAKGIGNAEWLWSVRSASQFYIIVISPVVLASSGVADRLLW